MVTLFESSKATGATSSAKVYYGVVVAIVTNNQDPDKQGRVKLKFPWLADKDETDWVRVAMPMAGNDRGWYSIPEVDDEVLVVFEHGDIHHPYVIGALWNGKDKPPVQQATNLSRMFKSLAGHKLDFFDDKNSPKISITHADGKAAVFLEKDGVIKIDSANGTITIAAGSGTIKLEANTIEIKANSEYKIDAGAQGSLASSGTLKVQASGPLTVKGALVNIN